MRVKPYRVALMRHGVAATVDHEDALREFNFRTVVDVGANRGQFTLFALHAFPAARLISFEPLAAPAARFRRLFADEGRVTLHHVALAPESGQTLMHVSGHDDSSSLLPISATQERLFRGTGEVGTEEVRTGPLHEFLAGDAIIEPALLKLDVQGYELEALRACGELLNSFTYVCAEGSYVELYQGQVLAVELIGWLQDRGFDMVRRYNDATDENGQTIQVDMLFRRRTSQ
ncbi:MAG: FkbM family methyltransferase [Mycolicibacterium cosmeticum]|nr:FkbM family methyltransferase [Mycolicibacterium cosmeticum]